MKKIELRLLEIEAPAPNDFIYHDDGFVRDLTIHRKELMTRYRINFKTYKAKQDRYVLGYMERFDERIFPKRLLTIVNCHIFYLDSRLKPINLITRVHEEMHVAELLFKLGHTQCRDYIEELMFERQGVDIDFRFVRDEEVRCEIAGIFALQERGFASEMGREKRFRYQPFEIAQRIYEESRIQ